MKTTWKFQLVMISHNIAPYTSAGVSLVTSIAFFVRLEGCLLCCRSRPLEQHLPRNHSPEVSKNPSDLMLGVTLGLIFGEGLHCALMAVFSLYVFTVLSSIRIWIL